MQTSLDNVCCAAQKIQQGADELQSALVATGTEMLETARDEADAYITEKPYKSILIAFGIGAFTTLFLLRRS